MRIAIMGSGGIGGVVGGRLAAAGTDVLFIARGPHLQAMRTSGLQLLGEMGGVTLPEVEATDDPAGRPPVDFVIFTVKAQDTPAAAELIAPLVGQDTGIVSFQNGVEGIDILAVRYGRETVLPGTTMTAAMIEEPGVVRHVGTVNQFIVGEWNGENTARVKAFHDHAQGAGLNVAISDDIHVAVWSKFVAMATFSALTCLTRLPVKTIASVPETRQLASDSMDEVIAVAKARGISLPADIKEKMFTVAEAQDPSWKTSMCNDLEAGKVIEADGISGVLHRLGQEFDVPTPVHTLAYRALKHYTLPKS
jgi:2-dehydropantoate 2-reductase